MIIKLSKPLKQLVMEELFEDHTRSNQPHDFDVQKKKLEMEEQLKERPPVHLDESDDLRNHFPALKHSMNAHLFPPQGESNFQPGLTIPGQTLTIREILDRHARGLPVKTMTRVPMYDGDEYFPDLGTMDLAEREQYIKEREEELLDLKTKIRIAKEEAERQKLADKPLPENLVEKPAAGATPAPDQK